MVPTMMDLGDYTLYRKWATEEEIADEILEGKLQKGETEEVISNIKSDSEMQHEPEFQRGREGGNKRERVRGRIRRSVLMYTQNSVSVIGNSQGLSPPPSFFSWALPSFHRHWNLYIQPISRNLYLHELTHKAYLGPSFLDFFLPSFHIYTEVFISNIDVEICCWNRSSTRTVSFLIPCTCTKNLHLWVNISPQGPDDQNRELYWTLFSKLHGKNQNKNHHTYAECICRELNQFIVYWGQAQKLGID